jgi:hypothetical protein
VRLYLDQISRANVAKLLFPLLAHHSQADFRNKLDHFQTNRTVSIQWRERDSSVKSSSRLLTTFVTLIKNPGVILIG